MKSWIYWGIATLFLAVIVHISIVLIVPVFDVGRRMAQFETLARPGVVVKIGAETRTGNLLVEPSPDFSYAFCRFDVSKGPYRIEASIPSDYWSLSVYSNTGDNVYSINDMQAGVRALQLLIVPAQAAGEISDPSPEITRNSLRYTTEDSSGLVMFRGFVPDESLRAIVERAISSARCEPVPDDGAG